MKLTIFGAGGRTGLLTVYQALDKGHFVTAFTRKASRVTIQHPKITIKEGDILNFQQVKEAVRGQEAVICTLGLIQNKPDTTLSEGTATIIRAMKESGVQRLICMSSAGILGNDTAWIFGKVIVPLFLRHVFRDKRRQMQLIKESGLDWIIIRPPRLTDAPKTGTYRITLGKPAFRSIPRADVADFMLKLLTDKKYNRQMPAIAGY